MANGGYDPVTHTMRGDIQTIAWIYPRSDADVDPEYYGDNLFIRWTGDANGITVTGRGEATEYIDSTPNQIIIRWPDATLNTACEVQVVGQVSNLLICREDQVADFDAGYVTTVEARGLWSNATDTRFMQIQNIHPSHITKVDQLAHFKDPFWAITSEIDHTVVPGTRSGFPLQACFKMCEELGTNPWVCWPAFLGAPDINETLGGVTDWEALGASHSAAVINDTSEYFSYSELVIESLDAAGVPSDRVVSLTDCNEIWGNPNPYGDATNYYRGAMQARLGTTAYLDYKILYGYQSAKMAHQMQLAKAATSGNAVDRTNQPVKILLEYQNAQASHIDLMEQGILLYESDHGVTLDRAQFETSPSNYIKGIFAWLLPNDFLGQTYSSSEDYFTAFWAYIESKQDYIDSNFDPIYDEFKEHLMNSGTQNTMYGILGWIQEGVEKALTYGFTPGCHYEGGSHEDTVIASAVSDLDNQPKRLSLFRGWISSQQHADLWAEFYRLAHIYFSSISQRYGVAEFYRIAAAILGVANGDNQPWFERDKYSSPNTPVEDVNDGVARRRKLAEAMV